MASTAWINLADGTIRIEATNCHLLDHFLGGRGIGAALLSRHLVDLEEPLTPENPFIVTTGPFTGTPWPTGARTHFTFLSPLTGIYGYANTGGQFGAALRRAGYDALVITGRADRPVTLEVTPPGVTIQPADHLWGVGTAATHDALETDGARVACIGPAGENGVRFAAVINDRGRAAARCGSGAAMGSKHLKAIVVRGKRRQDRSDAFRAVARRAFETVRDHPHVIGLRDWGTVSLVTVKNQSGDLPSRNHQVGQVPWPNKIDAFAIAEYTEKTKGCFACPIACGRVTRVQSGPHAGELEGPEYESLDALGPMCWIDDPEVIIHANRLCNDLGLDTISAGVVVAFAMECHEHGLLTDPDLSLAWGNPDTLLGLIERIARREGLGNLLAEGVRRAADALGGEAPRYAMHVKGMELPRQEPRVAKGFGLGHVTANRGADHLYALPTIDLAQNEEAARHFFPEDTIPSLLDPDDETYKPDLVVLSEHYCAISDALGVCKFSTAETYALYPADLAEGLSALWDRPISAADLLTAGERIVNLERMFNVRLGLSRADDRLPERFEEPLAIHAFEPDEETGEMEPSSEPVHVGRLRDFDAMLSRYYELRGWDAEAIPTTETLERLGL
jgi:aldehyde:ferredoxin oxidoreductase